MRRKLAIIHTTPVTIDALKKLVQEAMPDVDIVNFLDDSILPELYDNGGNVRAVEERWFQYVQIADKLGADCILSACSSVGELAWKARTLVSKPVLRIDEPMAMEAVETARVIGVAATLPTTLRPTEGLLKRKAEEAGKDIVLHSLLADEAYQRLMQGDVDGHDKVLADKLTELTQSVDVVVLAQASMARVIPRLPEQLQVKVLASPKRGIEHVRRVLETLG
ncbi:Asp/Glu/hydantoin racemase [Alicyclobacillus curvatus]|nr:Asp/Glu/hydantoin racemase [Alicyclobacillus curvatus]